MKRMVGGLVAMVVILGAVAAEARQAGPTWQELGGSATGGGLSASVGNSDGAVIILDSLGNPIVAWHDNTSGNYEIYLKRWDGVAWVGLGGSAAGGGISATAGDSIRPSLAIDASGNPVVAWDDVTAGNYETYLKRWNGTAWVEMGGSATAGGISASATNSINVSMAVNGSGYPTVAWQEGSNITKDEIYLRRWDGTAWVELGGSTIGGGVSASPGDSRRPSVALDGAGEPVVAWDEVSSTNCIYLKKWSGTAWIQLGGSATAVGVSDSRSAYSPSLAVDAAGNPIIAWEDYSPGIPDIYLKRWNGTAWVGLGASASGGGVSATSDFSWRPSMGLDGSGNPVIAWQDYTPTGRYEIYVRQWDGAAWVDLDGSGSGGGISDTPEDSGSPCVAVDSGGNAIVAWTETGVADIYLLRHLTREIMPASPGQYRGDGVTPIAVGGSTGETTVVIRALAGSIDTTATVRLEVEVQPTASGFTGIATGMSAEAAPGSSVAVSVTGLAAIPWHWRCRTVNSTGLASDWISFGGNPDGQPDFMVISIDPPGSPGGSSDRATGCSGSVSSSGRAILAVIAGALLILGIGRAGRRA